MTYFWEVFTKIVAPSRIPVVQQQHLQLLYHRTQICHTLRGPGFFRWSCPFSLHPQVGFFDFAPKKNIFLCLQNRYLLPTCSEYSPSASCRVLPLGHLRILKHKNFKYSFLHKMGLFFVKVSFFRSPKDFLS